MPDEHQHVSTRLRWLICKEAKASPQGHGSEFGLEVLSAGFCSSLLSEGKSYLHPGRGGTGFTWEPVLETVDKAEMQGFLRKRRRVPTSFRF